MNKIIRRKSKIEQCQVLLIDSLKKNLPKKLDRKIKGLSKKDIKIAIHNDVLWFASKKISHEGNYCNVFGLITNDDGELEQDDGELEQIVQINSPKEGISRHTGGVFAEDENGEYYILHRGNFQNRDNNISNEKSLDWWIKKGYTTSELDDGTKVQEVIDISSLEDDSLFNLIMLFVMRVRKLKIAFP